MVRSKKWKPVVGYEGLYEVSSKGDLKRLEGWTISIRKGYEDSKIYRPEKILKNLINVNGYLNNSLYRFDGKKYGRKHILIHRLVAEAFIGPQPTKDQCLVVFINGDKLDLDYKNLKWANESESQINARKNGSRRENPKGWDYFDSIPVNQINLTTGVVMASFGSYGQAEAKTKIPHQNIRKVIRGDRRSAGGYGWELYN